MLSLIFEIYGPVFDLKACKTIDLPSKLFCSSELSQLIYQVCCLIPERCFSWFLSNGVDVLNTLKDFTDVKGPTDVNGSNNGVVLDKPREVFHSPSCRPRKPQDPWVRQDQRPLKLSWKRGDPWSNNKNRTDLRYTPRTDDRRKKTPMNTYKGALYDSCHLAPQCSTQARQEQAKHLPRTFNDYHVTPPGNDCHVTPPGSHDPPVAGESWVVHWTASPGEFPHVFTLCPVQWNQVPLLRGPRTLLSPAGPSHWAGLGPMSGSAPRAGRWRISFDGVSLGTGRHFP